MAMFKILGADGKEYGPVTDEQLRLWIREGRAGGQTQVQSVGSTNWTPLHTVAEFAGVFRAVPLAVVGGLPPVVKTFGVLNIVVAAISLLYLLTTLFSLMQAIQRSTGFAPFTTTLVIFEGLAFLGVVIRIVSGVGLLRGREWARQLAVYYAGFAIVLGLYGLGRTAFWLATSGMHTGGLASISFLFSAGLNLVVLVFDIAIIVLLSRKEVRAALAGGANGAGRAVAD